MTTRITKPCGEAAVVQYLHAAGTAQGNQHVVNGGGIAPAGESHALRVPPP